MEKCTILAISYTMLVILLLALVIAFGWLISLFSKRQMLIGSLWVLGGGSLFIGIVFVVRSFIC